MYNWTARTIAVVLVVLACLMCLGCTTGAWFTEEYSRPASRFEKKTPGLKVEKVTPLESLGPPMTAEEVTLVSSKRTKDGKYIIRLSNGKLYKLEFPKEGAK